MKNRNWFWGIFFMLSGVFIIAGQIGSFGKIGIMSLLATVFLAAIAIHSIIKLNYFGIFVPLAFLYMIYSGPLSEPLRLPVISPWVLILTAILVSVGFSLIFPSHHKKVWHGHHGAMHHGIKHQSQNVENIDDNNPFAKVSLSSSSKYLHSDCLKSGHFICSMGELQLYFDQVQLSPEGAEIYLDCSLGSIKLYIPKLWNVEYKIHVTAGDVDKGRDFSNTSEDAPKLTLTGQVRLGNVEIQYI